MKRRAILTLGSVAMLAVLAAVVIFAARQAGPASRILDRANRLIESHPDSALNMLDSLDISGAHPQTQALHALLITQAMVKCGVPVPDDSLITTALVHYDDHGPDSLLMRASFYQAQVRYDLGDITRAVAPAVCAHDLAVEADDPYWRAKSAELLGFISSDSYYFDEAKNRYREAAIAYKKSGKTLNHHYSLVDYARALSDNGEYKRGIDILDSLKKSLVGDQIDTFLLAYCEREIFTTSFIDGDTSKADSAIHDMDALGQKAQWNLQSLTWRAMFKAENGDLSELKDLINAYEHGETPEMDASKYYQLIIYLSKRNHDYKKALRYTDSLNLYSDTIVRKVLKQSIVSRQRDYFERKAEKANMQAIKMQYIAILIAVALSLIIVFVFIVNSIRIKAKNQEIDSKMAEILDLSSQVVSKNKENEMFNERLGATEEAISGHRQEIRRLKNLSLKLEAEKNETADKIAELFIKQWRLLNSLCGQYFEYTDDNATGRKALVKNIQEEIEKFRHPKNIEKIVRSVNDNLGGIVERLYEECEFVKENDRVFISLLFAGFSAKAISMFTGIKLKTVYTKKARLIQKITSYAPEHKDLFLHYLG